LLCVECAAQLNAAVSHSTTIATHTTTATDQLRDAVPTDSATTATRTTELETTCVQPKIVVVPLMGVCIM